MPRLLLVRPEAERDLADARNWYEGKRAGLGDEFLDVVAAAMQIMARDPERARLYYRNFRRRLLRRFPYKIFYQVIGDRIVIFRVLHAKQAHDVRLTQQGFCDRRVGRNSVRVTVFSESEKRSTQ